MNAHHNLLALAAAGVILFSHGNVFASADTEAMQMASATGDASIAADTADTVTSSAAEESAADTAAGAADAVAASAAGEQTADIAGVPNPMVPYDSYTEMATALHFHPLYFPLSSGLELQQRFILGGNAAATPRATASRKNARSSPCVRP